MVSYYKDKLIKIPTYIENNMLVSSYYIELLSNDKKIAHIEFGILPLGVLKIDKLGTDSKYRGNGYAKMLIAKALSHFDESSVNEVVVRACADRVYPELPVENYPLTQEQLVCFYKAFTFGNEKKHFIVQEPCVY